MLTTEEAARRLGVKPATIYAYVSRGLLTSERNADGKGSLFTESEVEAFAAGRRRQPATAPGESPPIHTGITLIKDGALYYRGQDATELARTTAFESVATLLWTGALPPAAPAADEIVPSVAVPLATHHNPRSRSRKEAVRPAGGGSPDVGGGAQLAGGAGLPVGRAALAVEGAAQAVGGVARAVGGAAQGADGAARTGGAGAVGGLAGVRFGTSVELVALLSRLRSRCRGRRG